jgi:hypothetical protein
MAVGDDYRDTRTDEYYCSERCALDDGADPADLEVVGLPDYQDELRDGFAPELCRFCGEPLNNAEALSEMAMRDRSSE